MSAFVGSVWFAIMLGLVGYIAGHVAPISRFVRK